MSRTQEYDLAKELLYNVNITVTNQRLAILAYLLKLDGHPTAEEIYEELKDQLPILSKATVYNTLQTLVKENVLEELTIEKERARYHLVNGYHPHFFCTKCRKIFNLSAESLNVEDKDEIEGHKIEKRQCWFIGICSECRK